MVYVLIVILAVVGCAAWLYIIWKGNAEFVVKVNERTPFIVKDLVDDSITLICKVEMANIGKQCGTIMDCYTRHLLPYEQFDGVKVSSTVALETAPREDDYFESLIIYRRTSVNLVVCVTLAARKGQPIKEALFHMVDMPIDIVYQQVTREDWHIEKARIELKAEEVAAAIGITLAR